MNPNATADKTASGSKVELKIMKREEKKVALSKQFRVYVAALNKKQQNWLKKH